MGVRPPQRGDDEEPEAVAFGIAALGERLDRAGVTFPATREELLDALGGTSVPYDAKGNEMPFDAALEEAEGQEFDNRQQLMNELHHVFEARRAHASNTVVGRLRSLLPF